MRLLQFRVDEEFAKAADELAASNVGLGETVVQRLIFINGLLRIRERGRLLIDGPVGQRSSAGPEKDLLYEFDEEETKDGIEKGVADRNDQTDREGGGKTDRGNARRRR